MTLEFLKLLILLGTAIKSALARFWLGLALALVTIYLCVGLAAAGLFEVPWPGLRQALGLPVDRHRAMALVAVEALVCAAVCAVGWRRYADGTPRREATDLFALVAVISLIEVALLALL